MVLNLFSKKSISTSVSATTSPTTSSTTSPKERTPTSGKSTPKSSQKIGPPMIDQNKGIAYKSTRIIVPGGSLTANQTTPRIEQGSTLVESRKKRQPSPNNHYYKSKKANSQESLQNGQPRTSSTSSSSSSLSKTTRSRNRERERERERERVVNNRARPLRGSYRDRMSSISSRESLVLKEQKMKRKTNNPNHSHSNRTNKVAHQKQTPKPNPPYPIDDIVDITNNYISDEDNNANHNTIPSGFEQVSLRNFSTNGDTIVPITTRQPKRKNKVEAIPNITASHMESSNSLQVTSNEYYDAIEPEPTSIEAFACILERTGSKARNSRRARRARELRHQKSIQEGSSSDHTITIAPTGVSGSRSSNNGDSRNNNTPLPNSDVRVPILIIPDLNVLERNSRDMNLQPNIEPEPQHHQSLITNNPATPSQQQRPRQQRQQRQQQNSPQHSRQNITRPSSSLQETRNAIIARLNARVDVSMLSMDIVDPPPLDEYAPTEINTPDSDYSPPYREKLHRRVDLISFDPRYSIPVLRINKKLIKNKKNLRKVIRKLIKLQIVPQDINLWDVTKVDDGEFYNILPGLIHSIEQNVQEELQQRPEDFENDIQRAIAISLEEESQRQLFRGFRYQQRSNNNHNTDNRNRVIEQIVQSPDFNLNHGRFIDAIEINQQGGDEIHQQQSQEFDLADDTSSARRDLLRGFRYNQSRYSRAVAAAAATAATTTSDEIIHSPVLEQIMTEDEGEVTSATTTTSTEEEEELEELEELEENDDQFIDVDQAISNWYHQEAERRSSEEEEEQHQINNQYRSGNRFPIVFTHDIQLSSTSSFITAHHGLSV